MRILMIPSFCGNHTNPSSGSFFVDQAILMHNYGHDVSLIYPDTYSLKYIKDYLVYKEKNEVIDGVPLYRIRCMSPLKHNGIFGCEREFIKGCERIISKAFCSDFPFDLIHAQNCIWAGAAAKALSKKYSVPYVITEHSSIFDLGERKTIDKVSPELNYILDGSSKIVCVSQKLKDKVSQFTQKQIDVIGNVVDTNTYKLHDGRYKTGKFVFTSVAFLTTEHRVNLKGIDLLIEGFKILAQELSDVELRIVGIDDNIQSLRMMVKREGLEDRVTFIKPLERVAVFNEYKDSNCFVLLSKYETFGLVYAEAMATGLPVIASDVGIASEIVDDTTGIIIKDRSAQAVYKAMKAVYENYRFYDPHLIRKKIVDQYSLDSVASQINAMYEAAIVEGGSYEFYETD